MTVVVETGAVVANANSYVDVADADSYLRTRARATAWDALDLATKRGRLIQASQYLDATCAWRGDPVSSSQTMGWPRSGVLDKNGTAVDNDIVPTAVVNATIEVAVAGEITTEASRVALEETVGPISVKYAYGPDVTQGVQRYKYALALLTGLTLGSAHSATVVRA